MDAVFYISELKRLSTQYPFHNPPIPPESGGTATCNFDSEQEQCSWYNLQVGLEGSGFVKSRFESFFDVDKFECTSERVFAFRKFIFRFKKY